MAPAAPPTPAISLRDAVALSGRFPLLAGVDLNVAQGETLLLEGANGAGKTSLLRLCAGLVPAASGRVRVFGLDPVERRTVVRRRVGLLAHAAHLYEDLTVRENVRFAVRAAGAPVERVDPACQRLGLTGRLLRTRASKLSAGQRRRVAIAVLVARRPELWLLDEPHAGLDHAARSILDEVVTDATGAGATVVIASHESRSVEPLATRAVTLSGGRVVGERRLGPTPSSTGDAATAATSASAPSGGDASPTQASDSEHAADPDSTHRVVHVA
jgi:heme ABC exporter ATP-binding subunit CcmA